MNFIELRDAAADSQIGIADVLRKAKVFSYDLAENNFKNWVEQELNGYRNEKHLPPYRIVPIPSLGTFMGGDGSMLKNVVLPVFCLPEPVKGWAQQVHFTQSVGELEEMAEAGMQRTWPQEGVMLAQSELQKHFNGVLMEAHQPLTKSALRGVLDAVRNRLLQFLLELQQAHPEIAESNTKAVKIPQKEVTQIFNFSIQGDNNAVAAGQNVRQVIRQSVPVGDIKAIVRLAKELDVPAEDVEDLQHAIQHDGNPARKDFGPKVKEWLGKAMVKIATGLWQTGLQTAPTLISKALASYYGWETKSD